MVMCMGFSTLGINIKYSEHAAVAGSDSETVPGRVQHSITVPLFFPMRCTCFGNSLRLSTSLSFPLPLYFSLSLSVSVSLSAFLCLFLSVFMSLLLLIAVYLSVSLFPPLSLCAAFADWKIHQGIIADIVLFLSGSVFYEMGRKGLVSDIVGIYLPASVVRLLVGQPPPRRKCMYGERFVCYTLGHHGLCWGWADKC